MCVIAIFRVSKKTRLCNCCENECKINLLLYPSIKTVFNSFIMENICQEILVTVGANEKKPFYVRTLSKNNNRYMQRSVVERDYEI